MSLSMNIDKLLNTNEKVFEIVLKKLFLENLKNAKNELDQKYKFNHKLYDAIEFTLLKLKNEESIISRFLYKSFGVGKKKNRRRKHLILLGTQLKTEIDNIEKNIKRVENYQKYSMSSATDMTNLGNVFGKKVHIMTDEYSADKCNRYLKKIYTITDIINKSIKELDLKSIYLESSADKYRSLLKQIPRYHELNDNKYLENK